MLAPKPFAQGEAVRQRRLPDAVIRDGKISLSPPERPFQRAAQQAAPRMPSLRPCGEKLYQFVGDKARFEHLQACLGDVLFGLPVEASAVGPVNPGLPKARQQAANSAAWTGVFQAPD